MYYVYVIRERKKGNLYVGYTGNLKKRLKLHIKNRGDVELIYYEAFADKSKARARERALKARGSGWGWLKKRIGLT